MEFRSKSMPSFFKILIGDDFTTQLELPPYFVRQNVNTLPTDGDAKLQTVNEQSWYVKIENIGDGKHFFTKGWTEFVKSAKVKQGEFLVFWFDCHNSTFHVSGYGIHGCEYDISGCRTRVISDNELSEDQNGYGINGRAKRKASITHVFDDSSSPQLEIFLKKYRRSRVALCKEFGKHVVGKESVTVQYTPTQRSKKVMLDDLTARGTGFRLELAFGWSDFRKENGLEFGKSYLFVYNPERNVIQVSPVEKDLQVNVQGKDKMKHIARKLVTGADRCNLDPESSSARMKRKYVEECVLEDDSDNDSSEDQPVEANGKNQTRHTARKSVMRSGRCKKVDPESSSARIKRKVAKENVSEDDDDRDDDSSEVKIAGKFVEETATENDDDSSEDQTVGICRVKDKAAMTSVFDNSSPQFDNSSPQFKRVLEDYHASRLVLNSEFVEKADLLQKKSVYLKYAPTQRRTKVLLNNSCPNRQAYRRELALGWNDFRKENGLMTGKSYSFVYNQERNVILVSPIEYTRDSARVKKKNRPDSGNPVTRPYGFNMDPHGSSSRIKRDNAGFISTEDDDEEYEEGKDHQEDEMDVKAKERPQTLVKETSIAYQNAMSFKSNNPHFITLMQPSYVEAYFILTIPAAFAKENVPKEYSEIRLRIPSEGTWWNVRSVFRTRHASLSGGWAKFVRDNNLKVGDVCVFEVIKKLLWNVFIYRC